MTDNNEDTPRFAADQLDENTRREWLLLSARTHAATTGVRPSSVNEELSAAVYSEPESPVAPAYLLWIAENLAREARYSEAVAAFDSVIDRAQSVESFIPGVDFARAALHHKAGAASSAGNTELAITTLRELARMSPNPAGPLFQAGLVAEAAGRDDEAADLYRSAAGEEPSSSPEDPEELARRALLRLEDATATYVPSPLTLADLISRALESHDTSLLADLVSQTHFAAGVLGGHLGFEESDLLNKLYEDLLASRVRVRRGLLGSGAKRYLLTEGWRGEWFRGDVAFVLTQSAKGWQWTGLAISMANANWTERWRPAQRQENQPIPLELRAPWPVEQSFMAGGLVEFSAQQAAVIAAGLKLGTLLALAFSRNPCGFGPRGFYYNQGSTHDGADAFAIDFTRYRRNVPYDNESGGTPVLAPLAGIVVSACGDTPSGAGFPFSDAPANIVEILHQDPATGLPRFLSRYLHLAGPNMLSVSMGMAVIRGQRLGLMNDTGKSVFDHLHFSIHDQNTPFPGAGPSCGGITRGASVRPSPLDGRRLGDGDSATCIRSNNPERVPGFLFFNDNPNRTSIGFGPVPVNDTSTRTLTIENTTAVDVTVSFPPPPDPDPAALQGPFFWHTTGGVIASGGKMVTDIDFHPRAEGPAQRTLTVTSDGPGSPHSINLSGRGVPGQPL